MTVSRTIYIIAALFAILFISQLHAADEQNPLKVTAKEHLAAFHWTADESRWIKDHAGIIFYDGGELPRFTLDEQVDIVHALGTDRVKTWLKGEHPGEMRARLDHPVYQRILSEFNTILFDVCPDYILRGVYDDEKSKLVRSEYEGVAYYLASKYRKSNKTFLLSIFMETNLFIGTERSYYPDYPAVRFFNDADAGIKAGIMKARGESKVNKVKVYSVIEVANLPREFIKKFLPQTTADLYAISYYGQGELGAPDLTLPDAIQALSESVPHNGPFGKDNIMLGELGRSVFAGGNDGQDREQIQYLRKTLHEARENRLQYAFIFWATDQERSPDDGWGFTASKKAGAAFRRSWHAFQQIYGGTTPASMQPRVQTAIDEVRPLKYNPKPGELIGVDIDVSNRSSWYTPAAPAKDVEVQIYSGPASHKAVISLDPDEVVTLHTDVPAPDDSNFTIIINAPGSDAPIVKKISVDRADLVVDRVYTEPASPKPGDKVMLFAVVRNLGNTPITDFAVHFHVDDFKSLWVAWGCIYGDNKLKKGESQVIGGGFPWIATTPGVHKLRARVNPDGARESDYSNNITYGEVTVQP